MHAEDSGLLTIFVDESLESLAGLEASLIALAEAPDLRSEVEAIFRPVHTIKGSAPFFGFMEVQRLAHAMETILDHLRKGDMRCSKEIIDALLAGLDGLRASFDRIRGGEPEVIDAPTFDALVERLIQIGTGNLPTDPWSRVFALLSNLEHHNDLSDPALVKDFSQLRHDLMELRSQKPTSGTNLYSESSVGALRRLLAKPIETRLDPLVAEEVMKHLRSIRAACSDSADAKQLDEVINTAEVFIGSVGFDNMIRQHVLDCLNPLLPVPSSAPATDSALVRTDTGTERLTRKDTTSTERRTKTDTESLQKSMRVSEAAVDGFLSHVGELLVIGDQLAHLQRRLSASTVEQDLARSMRQAVSAFSALSTELQRSIMAVRRVSVRALLKKAPRLVRDLAQSSGKDMVVVLQGEETEVDKGRLDLLDAPLTHLVRNCADHGIEMPDERKSVGKPARGTITLKASSDESWFTLEVSDDGRGLNLEAIRKKGESLGLIKTGESLSEQVLIDLIFASGLSTAQKVTDVSGRGVGMDVVKRQIQEAGGTVSVTTRPGQGTTFCLRVPSAVSTQIIQACLVRDADGIYALPMEMVRESFVDEKASAKIGVVTRHGQVLPVAAFGTLMGSNVTSKAAHRTFVTLERLGLTLAVSVDETLGVRRLVICPLRGLCADDSENLFQGAALLGDGRMALVVDPDHLFRLLRQEAEIS